MADFVKLLKKAISAQVSPTLELRQRIYGRARETIEKKLAISDINPDIVELQRRMFEKAVREVEAEYDDAATGKSPDQFSQDEHRESETKNEFDSKKNQGEDSLKKTAADNYKSNLQETASTEAEENISVALPERKDSADEGSGVENPSGIDGNIRHISDTPLLQGEAREERVREADPLASLKKKINILHESHDSGHFWKKKDPHVDDSRISVQKEQAHSPDITEDRPASPKESNDILSSQISGKFFGNTSVVSRNGKEKRDPFSHDSLTESFVEELFADVNERQQRATGPLAFVGDNSSPKKEEILPLEEFDTGKDLPEFFLSEKNDSRQEQDIPDEEPLSYDREENTENENKKETNNPGAVSSLFAQALLRKKRLGDKKRILAISVIIFSGLVISSAVFWFLGGFVSEGDIKSAGSVKDIVIEDMKHGVSEKITQRLLPDGQEVDPGSVIEKKSEEENSEKKEELRLSSQMAEAVLHESSTDTQPRMTESGFVKWLLLHEDEDKSEDLAIRGDVSIPGKDVMLRMTIRRNLDPSIPAAYLIEMIFVVPENFHGGGIDRIGQLLFKASKQSSGQLLQGTIAFKIDDNFFVLAMNAPKPLLERNLGIMRQLPWMGLSIAYKNGQTGELSFAKGDIGDSIFKKVLDSAAPANEKVSSNSMN